MPYKDFVTSIHSKTQRDYLGRVNAFPKAEAAKIAKRFDREYWDGDRRWGYGGFKYDGRWKLVAKEIAEYYNLKSGDKVLDVGCGKAFLLYELFVAVPGLQVAGLDISQYAVDNGKEEVRPFLAQGTAAKLPYADQEFDLVISLNTLHNLHCYDLDSALREMERVGKNKYLVVESYRNEEEKANLLYWQLTCEAFCTPEEWQWWFKQTGFTGDYSFIYFE